MNIKVLKTILITTAVLLLISSCTLPSLSETTFNKDMKFRVVQISDLHINEEKQLYDNTINMINELDPDLLFITGDTIESNASLSILEEYLDGIESDCLKYAILGNWEYWGDVDVEEYKQVLERYNIKLLINEFEQIILNGFDITIYGIDDYLGGSPDLSIWNNNESEINLILAHCPILFDSLVLDKEETVNDFYMFSGHTHGGQITLFGKPLVLPEGSADYVAGLYEKGKCSLYVSRGIGNSTLDFRLFSTPTIELFSF